jgi:hypothetical protein
LIKWEGIRQRRSAAGRSGGFKSGETLVKRNHQKQMKQTFKVKQMKQMLRCFAEKHVETNKSC